jgi:hypothetical protein
MQIFHKSQGTYSNTYIAQVNMAPTTPHTQQKN